MHREAEACQHDRNTMSRCLACSSEQSEHPPLCGACGRRSGAPLVTLWPEPAVNAAPSPQASLRGGLISEFEARVARNVQEGPAAVDFLIGLADDLMRDHRLYEAKHLLDRVVAEAPAEFAVRLRRGACLAALGLYREALLDLERARAPSPGPQAGHLPPRTASLGRRTDDPYATVIEIDDRGASEGASRSAQLARPEDARTRALS